MSLAIGSRARMSSASVTCERLTPTSVVFRRRSTYGRDVRRKDLRESYGGLSALLTNGQHEYRGERCRGCQHSQADKKISGRVSNESHQVRPGEAAEIPDGVDQPDSCGGTVAAKKRRRQRPERWCEAVQPDRGER